MYRENRPSDSRTLPGGVKDMLPYFVPFHPMCMKFSVVDVHKNVLNDMSFVKINALKVIIYLREQVDVFLLAHACCPI